ncbi:ubiquitin-like small modifier protein 1 [Haloarchaeobius sp. HRN-SO-5]|uniref:ubiquitin-like small modifier protein 1 n=1 Tax=Haloarchaeobius sp. HRN-SO-5 TaxID=3446118 RepID=UPI003EB9AA1D
MQWKLFADLSERAGDDTVDVSVDAADPTVGDALDALLDSRPALRARVLTEDGAVVPDVNVLLDGTDVFVDGAGLETPVDEGAELALFPPVTGG